MREIKFRAWSKLLKKMLSHEDLDKTLKSLTKTEYIAGIFLPLNSDVEVMQYIGLKDSDGEEIYEGDIVERVDLTPTEEYYGKTEVGVVEYKTCQYVLKIKENSYYEMSNDGTFGISKYRVIGNIYENKELLSK